MNKLPIGRKSIFLILVMYLAFISLGLPDGLLGIAWPFMSSKYNVPLDALGILLVSFTAGYLITSSTNGQILRLLSLGKLLMISCLLTAFSLLTYAYTDFWYFAIVASFFLGSGGGAIDSSINTFVASRYSSSTVNWLHAFYGVGATTGPLLVTFLLARNFEWYHGYISVALIQISLSILFLFTQKYWQITSQEEEHHSGAEYLKTLKLPIIWINMFIFFLYTGFEQGFGQWIFTILTRSRGMAPEEAGLWTSTYWGSLTIGRILSGIVLIKVSVHKSLKVALIGIVGGAVLIVSDFSGFITFIGIIIIGLANAPVFPSLISITPERVGKEHAATAIGVQISAGMLGGSLLPGFAGLLSGVFGLEVITKVFAIAAAVLMVLYFVSTRRIRNN